MRCQLRRLCEHGNVCVAELPAFRVQTLCDFSQEHDAVRAFICGVIVRKQMPDVSQCRRTEQRIHQRVRQHIRVRMAEQTDRMRNNNSAQNQLSAGDQLVYVISVTDPHLSTPP